MREDTIAAITTTLGASSVGIIRLSGQDAGKIASKVFRSKSGIDLSEKPAYTITYGVILEENGAVLDEALALTMWEPHSFTGEDVVELQCHGGMVVLRRVLELVLQAGARMAEPGEFSKRAFLNGRMDISQAEAIMDLINAKTLKGVQAASNNLQGILAQEIKRQRDKILELMAYLEADIDFPEEEISRLSQEQQDLQLKEIEDEIALLLETYKSGRIIREGLKTVITGKPNVGKSSILNALLKEKRAIVTDIPGTTRDLIEECYNLGGIPLVLIDTAGIRDTSDEVERIGVERARVAMEQADLVLYVLDTVEGATEPDLRNIRSIPKEKLLVIINKIDLLATVDGITDLQEQIRTWNFVTISAKEGHGIIELENKINEIFFKQGLDIPDNTPYLSNTRHKDALMKARIAITSAREGIEKNLPSDFISIDLRQAWLALGEITGETLEDNIIEEIFSRFCLGK